MIIHLYFGLMLFLFLVCLEGIRRLLRRDRIARGVK